MRTSGALHFIFFCTLLLGILHPSLSIADPDLSLSYRPTQCLNQKKFHDETLTFSPASAEIPVPMKKPVPVIPLGCDRPFMIHGETYPTDSPQAQDAAGLKYFMSDVPEASSLLDDYQKNRQKSKMSAYTGTLGVLMILFSNTLANQFSPYIHDSVRSAFFNGGIALGVGGFMYSFILLRFNESLIPKSVALYNEAKSKNPIELEFSSGWSF